MREFFFCEKKNYAIVQSSKAIYSPQNGFLGFFSVTAKRDLAKVFVKQRGSPKVTAEEPFWKSQFLIW